MRVLSLPRLAVSRNAPLLAGGGPLQAASPELLFVTGGCDGGGDTTDTAPKVSPAQPSYRLQLYLTLTTRHMQGDTSWGYPVPFIPFSLI